MHTYIALFRGINVGGKNKLPMKALVPLLEQLAYQNIRTYIQSGNVVFDSAKPLLKKQVIELQNTIKEAEGFEPDILILQPSTLQAIIQANPFPTENGKALHCFILESSPKKPDIDAIQARKSATESFHLGKHAFYLHAPDGIGRSKLAASVERQLGVPTTARNWNTISKLAEMVLGT